MTPSKKWQGWRRRKGSMDTWEKVIGAVGDTRGQCYDRLMDLSELVVGDIVFEYNIVPENDRPKDQTYRTRVMYPR